MSETFPQTLAARMMQESSSRDIDEVCYPCQTGNRFWLESMSDTPISLAFSVDGTASPIVPAGREAPTLLPNTREGTRGKLEMALNGESLTLLENIDNALVGKPEDLACGLIVGPTVERRPSASNPNVYIPFSGGDDEEAELARLLPAGMDEEGMEVDLVPIWLAPPGASPLPEGIHHVDDLDDEALDWLWETLHLNTAPHDHDGPASDFDMLGSLSGNAVSTAGGEFAGMGRYLTDVGRQHHRGAIVQAFKELMMGGRFQVKRIASWGGRYAVVFKGNARSRSFLTAIMYGIDNSRVSYISSYAQVTSDVLEGNPGNAVRSAARGSAPTLGRAAPYVNGNFIGFFISATFDVKEFIEEEDPEKNWGELLGALGVTFIKVWAAGFTGILLAGVLAFMLSASSPTLLIIIVGAGIAIGVGMGLDWLDNRIGAKEWIKEKARNIGHHINNTANSAFYTSIDFIDAIQSGVRRRAGVWVEETKDKLISTRNSIRGMIFCGQEDSNISSRIDGQKRWCLIGE